jgi:hypothetical protein
MIRWTSLLRLLGGRRVLELEPASEAEMVVTFLRAELESSRNRGDVLQGLHRVRATQALIERPNLTSAEENAARIEVLRYRGYGDRVWLFSGFPAAVNWHRTVFGAGHLMQVKVLNQAEWVAYSGEGRLAVDASRRMATLSERDIVEAIASTLRRGGTVPEIIVVGTTVEKLVIIEGHKRVMAALNTNPTPSLAALVGLSPEMSNWHFH